jgi:DNA replication protein DnaC
MKALDKNLKINVEGLRSLLLQRKITQPRFRWNMSLEQAEDILTAAYKAEVEFRQMKPIIDQNTQSNIHRLAAYLVSDTHKFGVMFCGTCGNGKTTLLYAFRTALNYLCRTDLFEEERKSGFRVGLNIVDAKDVQSYARDMKSFKDLKNHHMIAIEDMGREATEVLEYGNVLNPVIDLLEYRYNTQAFTMITTNLTGKQIREKYGNRIADRFNEMMEVIIFKGDTYRK